jgi:hypothetical protein
VLDALTGADKPDPPRLAPEFVNEHVGIGTLDDEDGMSTIGAFRPIKSDPRPNLGGLPVRTVVYGHSPGEVISAAPDKGDTETKRTTTPPP